MSDRVKLDDKTEKKIETLVDHMGAIRRTLSALITALGPEVAEKVRDALVKQDEEIERLSDVQARNDCIAWTLSTYDGARGQPCIDEVNKSLAEQNRDPVTAAEIGEGNMDRKGVR